jgi:tRNA threonylcarbamoyladenosine modification (KEOPS) complex Cgi121 subunit
MSQPRSFQHKLGDDFVFVTGAHNVQCDDPGKLVDNLRTRADGVSVQLVNPQYIYGIEHVLGSLSITLQARDRKIMLANKPETDLLLRLFCTSQISSALSVGRIESGSDACFIMFSKEVRNLDAMHKYVLDSFEPDSSVLSQTDVKRKRISENLGLTTKISEKEFLELVLERAAILQ